MNKQFEIDKAKPYYQIEITRIDPASDDARCGESFELVDIKVADVDIFKLIKSLFGFIG